jgi:hypothetical protein
MRLLKGLYTRGGLSLKLGTKGETVNEAKYTVPDNQTRQI